MLSALSFFTNLFHLLLEFLIRLRSLDRLEKGIRLDSLGAGIPQASDIAARNRINDFFVGFDADVRVFVENAVVSLARSDAVEAVKEVTRVDESTRQAHTAA